MNEARRKDGEGLPRGQLGKRATDESIAHLKPASAHHALLEAEPLGVENASEVNLALDRGEDVGGRIEALDEAPDLGESGGIDEVGLVDDDDVRKLELVHHEVGDVALVLLVDGSGLSATEVKAVSGRLGCEEARGLTRKGSRLC